jgi:hypothetical protein
LRDVRGIVGDVEFELLGNLAAVDQSGDGQADPGCAVQREETGPVWISAGIPGWLAAPAH